MIAQDWHAVPAAALEPLFTRERQRWLAELAWDPAENLAAVERARVSWGLPGLVALDDSGRLRGFLFYLHERERFEIGGITADTPAATCALLNGLTDAATLAHVRDIACFAYESAPALALELSRRDFVVEPFHYLGHALAQNSSVTPPGEQEQAPLSDGWRPDDDAALARLLAAAYDARTSRHLVPDHTDEEWRRYVRNLVLYTGCGAVEPELTRVIRSHGEFSAAAVVTTIAEGTAHLAQLAVRPEQRGSGLAARLVTEASQRAAARGFATMTLLVAAGNAPARALYARMGFSERGTFVSARRATTYSSERRVA